MRGIITLCGSTRFKKDFNDMNFKLTLDNWIVLSVGSFLHSDNDPEIKNYILEHKEQLDILHKQKITMSDCILIVGDGYIGDSTKSEITFAKEIRKPIYWQVDYTFLNLAVDYPEQNNTLQKVNKI